MTIIFIDNVKTDILHLHLGPNQVSIYSLNLLKQILYLMFLGSWFQPNSVKLCLPELTVLLDLTKIRIPHGKKTSWCFKDVLWRHSRHLDKMSFRHLKNVGFADLEDALHNCLKGISCSWWYIRHVAKAIFRHLIKIVFKTRVKGRIFAKCLLDTLKMSDLQI